MTPASHEDLDPITLARFLSGESNASEAARVRRWIASDPTNAELVEQLRAVWAPGASKEQGWDVEGAWRRVRPRLGPALVRPEDAPRRLSRRPMLAPPAQRTGARWRAPVAIAAALMLAVIVWRTGPKSEPARGTAPVEAQARSIATRAGERAEITLGDGVEVVLAPDSRLHYAARSGSARLDVYLEGEAFFRVRHDTARVFVVHTADAVTEDLGTEFSVRRYTTESATRVVVGEGRVALRGAARSGASAAAAELAAGDLGRVGRDGRAPVVERVDSRPYFAWTGGWLVFHDATLATVSAELARWYDIDIVIADSTLLNRHLVASFKAATADDALHIVASSLGVNIERHGRRAVISRKRTQ